MKIGSYKRSFTVEPVQNPVPRKDARRSESLSTPPPPPPRRVRVKTHV
jgi:hypothetical protein